MKQADNGVSELEANVDSLIVVLNEKLLEVLGGAAEPDNEHLSRLRWAAERRCQPPIAGAAVVGGGGAPWGAARGRQGRCRCCALSHCCCSGQQQQQQQQWGR
jgi:hypothetical protein